MKNKDLSLVNLNYYGTDTYVPMGCLYLISWLKKYGFSVDFRDFQLTKARNVFSQRNILSFFKDTADIIGISCMGQTLPNAIWVSGQIKKDNPKKIIILGGHGPSLLAKEILFHFPFIDIVVIGDGEHTLVELTEALKGRNKPLKRIPGIAFRRGNEIILTPPRNSSLKIESMFTCFEAIDLHKYRNVVLFSGKGCIGNCTFCPIKSMYPGYIPRDIADIYKEFDYIVSCKTPIKKVVLQDESFVFHKDRLLEFCALVKKNKKIRSIKLGCYGKIDFMDEERMSALASCGFLTIFYGIESGSDRVLGLINKRITSEMARKVVLASKKYFKTIITSFIWGFPFEEKKDLLETVFLINYFNARGIIISLHLLAPMPGTRIYSMYRDKLCFREDLVSNVVWGMERIPYVKRMVKNHLDVFPYFLHYDSGGLKERKEIIEKSIVVPKPIHIKS